MTIATLIASDLNHSSVSAVVANDEVKKELAKNSLSVGFPVAKTANG